MSEVIINGEPIPTHPLVAARIVGLEVRLAQFEQGAGAGESEWTTLRNRLNLAKAKITELEAALDKATDLLAMVGTEPLDQFLALIKPLEPQAAKILANNLESFS